MTIFQHFHHVKFQLREQWQTFHNQYNFFAAELEERAIQEHTRDSLQCEICF